MTTWLTRLTVAAFILGLTSSIVCAQAYKLEKKSPEDLRREREARSKFLQMREDLYIGCLANIQYHLKDPDSAIFPDVDLVPFVLKGKSLKAEFVIRAKNSFGGYVGTRYRCYGTVNDKGDGVVKRGVTELR